MKNSATQREDISKNGFTVVEVLVVIAIMGILAGIAIPSTKTLLNDHTLNQYATNMEYIVRYAKMKAIEQTTNVGICASGNSQLILFDLGKIRPSTTASSCPTTGGTTITGMNIPSAHVINYGIALTGSACSGSGYPRGCIVVDPRGLAMHSGDRDICISNNRKYNKVLINRIGMRVQSGGGACP